MGGGGGDPAVDQWCKSSADERLVWDRCALVGSGCVFMFVLLGLCVYVCECVSVFTCAYVCVR